MMLLLGKVSDCLLGFVGMKCGKLMAVAVDANSHVFGYVPVFVIFHIYRAIALADYHERWSSYFVELLNYIGLHYDFVKALLSSFFGNSEKINHR